MPISISFKKVFIIPLMLFVLCFTSISHVFAIDGVYHDPYGIDDLYQVNATERYPRDPIAGEDVYIKITTWPIESGQATWVSWTKNGQAQPDIGGEWKYNDGNNSYWEAHLGSFDKGDVIQYYVHANKDGTNEQTIGPFEFTVTDWEYISSVSGYVDYANRIEINASPSTGNFAPKINISFTADDVFRVQMSPNGTSSFSSGLSNYSLQDHADYLLITTSKLQLRIDKSPYKLSVYEADGSTLVAAEYDSSVHQTMGWLTDGHAMIDKVENHFYTPEHEQFYGFGERYNQLGKRGTDIDTYVYNQYQNQDERTYMAIPFFLNTNGYGVLLNTNYYSKFKLATERSDMYSFTANTGGASTSMLDYYFIYGDDLKDVVSNYTEISGKPELLPKWAFGLWMSANEWDRQSEVSDAIQNSIDYDIPATAIVLEQWSDETTFYIFNDAQYTPKSGEEAFQYRDFTFPADGRWPDPKEMADEIHANGMKLLMWQVPIQKYITNSHTQKDNDEAYMISQGYAVGNGAGGQYRIPEGRWFSNSLLVDFTNPMAEEWWLSKRAYLFDEIGIDGFKTDGGEMVWGRWNTFYNGKNGDEMRNVYPNEYIRAYNEFAHSKNPDSITFSRSGTTGAQKYQAYWAGDQSSTFYSYQQALNAGLSANMSGVPFWGWDLAGFTGSYPSSELYKRSISMAAFNPIMQFHSEKADPSPSEERSPWNAVQRTGDATILDVARKYVNTRMNLIPYIYSEAKKTSESGVPIMRAMVLEYPQDENTYELNEQYMFGDQLLVAPVMKEGETTKQIYLPEGEWIDFWWGAQRPGGRTISYYASEDDLPVFVKAGSIIPMNLNENYELGGSIGNDLSNYTNLTFRIYPQGTTSYDWYDDIGSGTVKTITSHEQYDSDQVTLSIPQTLDKATLQVFTSRPDTVTVDGQSIQEVSNISDLISSTQSWYYDAESKFTFVKLPAGAARTVVLEGTHKAEYEAEFAALSSTATNNNHTGYTGTGFVDQFETSGDAILFDVYVDEAGEYILDLRYSSAGGTSMRGLYVNDTKSGDITLPSTLKWDTWNIVSTEVSLQEGHNTVKLQYDTTSSLGINVDHIAVHR